MSSNRGKAVDIGPFTIPVPFPGFTPALAFARPPGSESRGSTLPASRGRFANTSPTIPPDSTTRARNRPAGSTSTPRGNAPGALDRGGTVGSHLRLPRPPGPCRDGPHARAEAVPGHLHLRRDRGPDRRGQRGRDPRASPPRQGGAGHRQDRAGPRGGPGPRQAPDRVARQVLDQGPARPLRVRRRVSPPRLAARLGQGARHRELHRARQALGRVRGGARRGPPDRRDRQGGHRVPQRSAAGARPDGVLRLRDEEDRERARSVPPSSSPRTTRRSCPTRSSGAASSTTSASPTATR